MYQMIMKTTKCYLQTDIDGRILVVPLYHQDETY